MNSVPTRSQSDLAPAKKKQFNTIWGVRPSLQLDPDDPNQLLTLPLPTPNHTRHKPIDAALFSEPSQLPPTMVNNNTSSSSRLLRHPPVAANEDGPWSISVAETPNDPRSSYAIYVKTPTHHLTLMRSSGEIVDLHDKLRDAHASSALPTLPIDASAQPQKRRSSFLHTLSRLASPSSSASKIHQAPRSPPPSNFESPVASPAAEMADPFASPLAPAPPLQSPTFGLGAYLTAIANDPSLRTTRVWRKFVRVRTDDLQSVRVERAIKRVRSDLAAHPAAAPAAPPSSSTTSVADSEGSDPNPPQSAPADGGVNGGGGFAPPDIQEEEEGEADAEATQVAHADAAPVAETEVAAETATAAVADAELPRADATEAGELTPSASTATAHESSLPTPSPSPPSPTPHALRIPRSASADPDRSSRLSRAWSAPAPDGETEGDEEPPPAKPPREKRGRKVVIDDFEMMRVLGKGCAGKVLLVRHKASAALYALKAITKRHVLAHQELQHTLTEQAVLKRMAHEATDPFVVKLWWSFHDKENLFLVMDFHPGGDLATQLARWGRLGRDRARFYAAEIVEGVEGLHAMGVIYRDLKPENILIGADGHIVLTDFGLSKEFPRPGAASQGALPTAPSTPSGGARSSSGSDYTGSSSGSNWMGGSAALPYAPPTDVTSTFCGTAEYLAPEVIQGLPYSYEVDWWSFGTMLFEMLTGITPFWANNHSDMYVRVLQDELQFPDDRAMDQDTKSLIRGLLQRNPALRMREPRIKRHPYFSMIDWSHVYYKRYIPPYIPPIDPGNASDTQNFDDTFLDMDPTLDNEPEPESELPTDSDDKERTDNDERTDGEESVKTPPAARSPRVAVEDEPDLFDGYSFKGRQSVIIDDEEDDGYEGPDEHDIEEDGEEAAVVPVEPPIRPDEEGESTAEGTATPQPAASTPPAPTIVQPSTPTPTAPIEPPKRKPAPPSPSLRSVEMDSDLRELAADASRLEGDLEEEETLHRATAAPATPAAVQPPPTPEPAVTPHEETTVPKPKEPAQVKSVTIAQPKSRKWRAERSGVAALDRNLGDILDEDEATEREDDDWDFIERPHGEEINGVKGTSLFARGVVDRYRLAVFRKSSPGANRALPRSVSGMSTADSEAGASEVSPSPTPSDKIRRGRSSGLSLRKTKQFLRARSPVSSFAMGSGSRSTLASSSSATISVSNTGLLTPSPSVPLGIVTGPALKNKMSTVSVTPSSSSDQSASNGPLTKSTSLERTTSPVSPDEGATASRPGRTTSAGATSPQKPRTQKLKKYKGAEKVFALFGSPRQ